MRIIPKKALLLLSFFILLIVVFSVASKKDTPTKRTVASHHDFKAVTDYKPVKADKRPLSDFCPTLLADRMFEAGSEQMHQLHLGISPYEAALGKKPKLKIEMPAFLEERAETQAKQLSRLLKKDVQFEVWPVEIDGIRTWVFSRWRDGSQDDQQTWNWMQQPKQNLKGINPIFPFKVDPNKTEDKNLIFTDFANQSGLYDKPSFSDVVWTSQDDSKVYAAWLPSSEREPNLLLLNKNPDSFKDLKGYVLPRPSEFNGQPITFVITVENKRVIWPKNIEWIKKVDIDPKNHLTISSKIRKNSDIQWNDSFSDKFKHDTKLLSGEEEVNFSGKKLKFTNKNNSDPDNQLETLADYLVYRYSELGLKAKRMTFEWRNKPQSNLIIKIKGSLPKEKNRPIILADHFDTAYAEDVFDSQGKRISAPGANDNVSGTVTLLRAAEELKHSQPRHDIWLIHLTGEEFPADDLGARVLSSKLRQAQQKIGGIVVVDMIGFNISRNPIFQINAGTSESSIEMALIAYASAIELKSKPKPVIRDRFDSKSYLYNTDALIFDNDGFPTILINEHTNRFNLGRSGYHDMTDTSKLMDFAYAVDIAKVAIQTTLKLANR